MHTFFSNHVSVVKSLTDWCASTGTSQRNIENTSLTTSHMTFRTPRRAALSSHVRILNTHIAHKAAPVPGFLRFQGALPIMNMQWKRDGAVGFAIRIRLETDIMDGGNIIAKVH